MIIRVPEASDTESLWTLLEPVIGAAAIVQSSPTSCADALAHWTGAPNRGWIAVAPKPLGTFYLRPGHRGPGAHVGNASFVTAPRASGRGLARAMLARAKAEAEAIAGGFLALQFNFVVSTNTAALHLWESCGYTPVGRLPGAFRRPAEGFVDALVLHTTLVSEE